MTTAAQPASRRSLGVAGQTVSIFGARVFAASCTAVLTVVLARVLGPSGFGRYALALTVAMIVGYCAELGIGPATGRFVAERLAAGGSIARVAREGLRVKLAIAMIAFGTLLALAGPIAGAFGDPGLATLIRVAAAGVLFGDVFLWVGAMFESLRDARSQVWMIAAKAISELAAALVLVLGGAGALGAVAGNAIGFAAGAALGLVLLRPALHMTPDAPGVGARVLLGYGANIWIAGVAWLAFERVDQVLLGFFRSTSAVALYEAPWRLVGVLILATVTLAAVIGPRLVGVPPQRAAGLLTDALRFAVLLSAVTAAIVGVLAGVLVPFLLGDAYTGSVPVLRALIPFLILVSLAPLLTRALDYLGAARSRRWIALTALGINIVLDLVLIPAFGTIGPAIASDIAMAWFVGGHLVLVARRLPMGWSRLATACLHAVMLGVAAAAAAAVIGAAPAPAPVRAVGGVVAGLAVALAAARALGYEPEMREALAGVSVTPLTPLARSPGIEVALAAAAALVGGAAAASDLRLTLAVAAFAMLAWLLLRDLVTGLVTFVLIAPLTQLPQLGSVSGQLAKVAGALLAATWLLTVIRRGERRPAGPWVTAGIVCITLFLVWGAASSAWALSDADALRSLSRWTLDAVLLVIVATSVHRWSAFRAVAGAIALAALLSTLAGLGGGGVEGRLGGALGDPNVQAAALVPAILLAGALALDSRDLRRLAWASVSAACLVALLATGSRGGLIGLAVACATMVAVGGRWRRPVATGLAVALVAGAGYVTLAAPQTIRDRLGSITSSAATDGGAGRTDIWRVGTRTFRSAPVEGVGLGNYSDAVVNHLNEPGLIRRPDVVVGQTKVAHNTYLEILTETGIVGFLLFIGLVCSALGALAGAIRGPAGDAAGSGPVLRALFAATVGVLTANFFVSGQYETVLWVVLGLSLASTSLAWSPVPARLRPRPATAPALAGGRP